MARGTRFDAIRAVEACYQGGEDDRAWLSSILETLAPLDAGPGFFGQIYRLSPDGSRVVEEEAVAGALTLAQFRQMVRQSERFARHAPAEATRLLWAPTPPVEYVGRRIARGRGLLAHQRSLLRHLGVGDALGIFGSGPDGGTVLISSALPTGEERLPARTLHQLTLFAAHLGASLRLRRALRGERPGPSPGAPLEAVLDPRGRVLDAEGGARPEQARRSLADAVRRMERARGPLRRVDPEEALGLWRGLVEGRWSLVDQCDSDGKRYLLARRNSPGVADPRRLTERQRSVLAFAAMGYQNKLIGYQLGLSPSAVSSHLEAARRKLGCVSRAELMRRFGPLLGGAGPV